MKFRMNPKSIKADCRICMLRISGTCSYKAETTGDWSGG